MSFKLSDAFIQNYQNDQPSWGSLGYIVYKRTYARELSDGSIEEFWQTIRRVVEGVYSVQRNHCQNLGLPWNQYKAQKSAQKMYDLMWNFKFLPAGRGLWMMGTDYVKERGSACLNNCAFVSTKNIDIEFSASFIFLMDMLMLGVGCGFDTKGAGKVLLKTPKYTDIPFIVEDSREGWVSLIETILDSFVGKTFYPKNIDYSKIREKGVLLKGFGGISSGSGPLKELVESLTKLLLPQDGQQEITSTQIVDIVNYISKVVVSGNIRRSAALALGSKDDKEYLNLKLDKKALKSHRWTSNNSISCNIGMNYKEFAEKTIINGEPGYVWLENCKKYGRMNGIIDNSDNKVEGVNPCSEQTLESYELCNLVETFPSNHDSFEEWKTTLKYAYLYAKSITLIPTHNQKTNAVMLRNRRIGTSISGITAAFNKFGRREFFRWCDKGYEYLKELDKMYSDWLCVPISIKISTVKPSGSTSLIPGVPAGIHYPHSKYYIRNIRFASNSPYVEILKNAGYNIENCVSDEKNTVVISFPVCEKYFDKGKNDVTIWEQAENAAQIQEHWSDNSVSCTINFKKSEAKDIARLLELYETRLKSISFLPIDDHGYEQAPYITITKEEYEEMVSKLKPYNLSIIKSIGHEKNDAYCSSDSCEIKENR